MAGVVIDSAIVGRCQWMLFIVIVIIEYVRRGEEEEKREKRNAGELNMG